MVKKINSKILAKIFVIPVGDFPQVVCWDDDKKGGVNYGLARCYSILGKLSVDS